MALLPSGSVMVPPVAAEMGCDTCAMVPATMTDIEADFEPSCRLVAAMVTVYGDGTFGGATYSPEELIVPNTEFPPAMPFTDQATSWL